MKSKHLTEDTIYESILEMKRTYEQKKKNAELISMKIREEGGVEEAVKLIEKII